MQPQHDWRELISVFSIIVFEPVAFSILLTWLFISSNYKLTPIKRPLTAEQLKKCSGYIPDEIIPR